VDLLKPLRTIALGVGLISAGLISSGADQDSPVQVDLTRGRVTVAIPWPRRSGDLGIEIDFGLLYKEPGAILQRKERDSYRDYLVDGEPVVNPFDVETLPPGWYRLRDHA